MKPSIPKTELQPSTQLRKVVFGGSRAMKKLALVVGSVCLAFPFCSSGATIWSEPFTYADGSLTNVSGGLWTTHSGTATPILVSGNQVTGMSAGATSREDSNRLLDATYSTGVLFAGFDLTLSSTPVGSAYFAHFKDSTTSGFRGRVFLGAPTSAGFRIGLENDAGDNGATVAFTSDLTLGATYRVVLGYDTAARTSRLWVNNSVEGTPTLADATAPTFLAITSFALRQGASTPAAYTGLDLDNLNVATDFTSAYTVPEPSTIVLTVLGGLLGLLALRRKR